HQRQCIKSLLSIKPMSALGHKRTCAAQKGMSALRPIATAKADIRKRSCPLYPRKRTFTLSCRRRRRRTVAVLTQSQGKGNEENTKYDRISRDGPDQAKCASPWGNKNNGAEYYRQHAPKD